MLYVVMVDHIRAAELGKSDVRSSIERGKSDIKERLTLRQRKSLSRLRLGVHGFDRRWSAMIYLCRVSFWLLQKDIGE